MSRADALLARHGHYLGATFLYAGEWYWVIDRLHYLEERLHGLGAGIGHAHADLLFAPPLLDLPAANRPDRARSDVQIEMFGSFRSPCSCIACDRVRALAHASGVGFCFRPVLPMLMRGLAVPRQKSPYILGDVAREARRMGIPFGRACAPPRSGCRAGLCPDRVRARGWLSGRLRFELLAGCLGRWNRRKHRPRTVPHRGACPAGLGSG